MLMSSEDEVLWVGERLYSFIGDLRSLTKMN